MIAPLHKSESNEAMISTQDRASTDALHEDRRPRRFSQGIERMPHAPANARVGRFSDGIEHSPRSAQSDHVGTFAEGIAQYPDDPGAHRIGSFADGYVSGHR
jgi:hypothetical protein